MPKNRIYFASDFHLDNTQSGLARERKVVAWLDSIKTDASKIYLLGDVFDFWFEYKHVVPKGYVRLLGKLAEISDSGAELHIFTGNHDLWMFDYLVKELNASVYHEPIELNEFGKRLQIGHGDGLGPGDYGYKFIKNVFANKSCQRLFAALHPRFGITLAHFFSKKSRESTGENDSIYLGDEKEYLVRYCNEANESKSIDYFIFGHRHMVIDLELKNGGRYINLGAWFSDCRYAVLDEQGLRLEKFEI